MKKSSFQSADKSLSKYRIYLLCEELDERSPQIPKGDVFRLDGIII